MEAQTKHRIYVLAGVVVAAVYVLMLWRGPWMLDGAHLRERDLQPADGVVITGVRTMLVALGAGVIAALGLYYTRRTHQHAEKLYAHSQEQFAHAREKDREQAELTREGQVTERYVEAIKLLGSSNLHQRLGGIYSLERIMNDSDKDHRTAVEVLSAFVRTPVSAGSTPATAASCSDGTDPQRGPGDIPAPDVAAALTVLGRQPVRDTPAVPDLREARLVGAVLRDVSLEDVNLQGAILTAGVFEGVSLFGAHLASATLTGAAFRGSDLSQVIAPGADLTGISVEDSVFTNAVLTTVRLTGADLAYTDFRHANLTSANLTGADLVKAKLQYACLEHADLSGAKLEGADLTYTDLVRARLIEADLTGALLDQANLAHADLGDAMLDGADLSTAHGLSVRQLLTAHITGDTELPDRLARDPRISNRIKECEAASRPASR
ncbi:pentapeptide repeat-containing protein [Streptomyces olivaceus]|uniref:pentapeptide repeat-containing protein n=1 Tax=Streptomyces olivaceus TaxID=47716 RepID=UPI0012FE8034|nr:pentapeptide repeat-containing protein [Streptomyces olivaceus]MBZ6107951.1 pentapeptide repeat-containing protein [Streptomyces olivaceus]